MPAINRLRADAFANQKGRCYYCGSPMWLTDPDAFRTRFGCTRGQLPALQATAEHLVAVCDGGKTTAANIVAAHQLCNRRRHLAKVPLAPDRYRARVTRLVARGKWFDKTLHAVARQARHIPG
ncbi:HNH endonuclease [Arenimonas sp. MALMAid1274]|uniref:HNH endonuclease n=1 Tax=Arenimonas sp. MALMAid1274 TaxID=3411630 RepID=UPI003BA09F84